MNPDETGPQLVRKTYVVNGATLDDNCLKGAPSVMGVLDRGNDCIFPGFFSKGGAVKRFLENGFVAMGHDWSAPPIAMPTKAEERGNILYSEAEFHSTQAAQDCRGVMSERIAKGLSVGLSVGFMTKWDSKEPGYKYFDGGDSLLAYAESLGCKMDLFDSKTIKSHKGYCRGLLPGGCEELFEYSFAPVPMNPYAVASDVKSFREDMTEREFEDLLRDVGLNPRQAKTVISRGFKGLQRDADESVPPAPPVPNRDRLIALMRYQMESQRFLVGENG